MSNTELLLDTHAWIWLVAGTQKISSKILSLIETAHKSGTLYLSDISLWEISMLAKKQRIILNQPISAWLRLGLKLSGVHLVRLTPEISIDSADLPGVFHGDPADRLIVATTRTMGLTLLTRDQKILEYGALNHVQALKI